MRLFVVCRYSSSCLHHALECSTDDTPISYTASRTYTEQVALECTVLQEDFHGNEFRVNNYLVIPLKSHITQICSHCASSSDDTTMLNCMLSVRIHHAQVHQMIAQRRFPFNARLTNGTHLSHSRYTSSFVPTALGLFFAARTRSTTATAICSAVTPVGRSTSTSACASAPASRSAYTPHCCSGEI